MARLVLRRYQHSYLLVYRTLFQSHWFGATSYDFTCNTPNMRRIIALLLLFRCSAAYDPWYYVAKEQTYSYLCSDNRVVDYKCNCETEGKVLCTVEKGNATKIENLDENFLIPDETKLLDLNHNEIFGISRGAFNCNILALTMRALF